MKVSPLFSALFAACLALIAAAPGVARADIEVDVNQGAVQPLPIAIPAFTGAVRGAEIAQVITDNLMRSGLFAPISPATYPEQNLDVNIQPAFPGWKQIGAQALINGNVTVEADGRLRVDFRLWDVFSEQQLLGVQFSSTPENWRGSTARSL